MEDKRKKENDALRPVEEPQETKRSTLEERIEGEKNPKDGKSVEHASITDCLPMHLFEVEYRGWSWNKIMKVW